MKAVKSFSITAGLLTAWTFSTWVNSYEEFSSADSISFALYFATALLFTFLVYAALFYVSQKRPILAFVPHAANALICVFGLHSLVLIHIEQIAGLGSLWIMLMLSGVFAVFVTLFKAISDSKDLFKFVFIFIGIFIAQNIVTFAWGEYERYQVVTKSTIPAHFSYPEFKRRPNVYLIGFDALVPASIGKQILGIDDLKYVSFLEQKGFRALRNSFADRIPTGSFYNSMAAMDKEFYDSTERPKRHMFETGEVPAPLHEIFRRNGYKIQFLYKSSYFGIRERAKIDYYDYTFARGICTHVDVSYGLFGYCFPIFSDIRNRFSEPGRAYPDYLFKRIKVTATSGEPWLTIAHIWNPGHTGIAHSVFKPEDVKSYRKIYEDKSKRVVESMKKLINTIRENDPEAILFIFGDHGTFISRGLKEGGVPEGSPMTEKEVFLDRRANAVFVYPKDFCADEFKEPYGSMRLGRSIAKCLSGGKDPLPADYQANDNEYLPYLYE